MSDKLRIEIVEVDGGESEQRINDVVDLISRLLWRKWQEKSSKREKSNIPKEPGHKDKRKSAASSKKPHQRNSSRAGMSQESPGHLGRA